MPNRMIDRSQPAPSETSAPDAADENPLAALEADARDSIAKALELFENGEREVAEHMFERLRERVRQAGPVAMLVSGNEGTEECADLQSLVSAIADVTRSKPDPDDTPTE
ncbi:MULTISPECIES: hypothetical protein [Asticcacaulis]|uniref:hypothetical protein n=1 Tax=Asticcacaulis TaxID=76890 RepID=UPI001AE610CB|nr:MULTISPECIES: hypothetical protein [Asticcacaulis]MBP2159317.1 hypothetical protein [Asticcacaulis solisilvae]MDR6800362.1 hypothetical protein [Asticcacaulis sp. BE141]